MPQLGEEGDESDKSALPASLRGRSRFKDGFGIADVYGRQLEGWRFRKTRLTEKFGLDDALANLPAGADPLMLVRPNGKMRFFTHAMRPMPEPEDIVITYAPPEQKAVSEGTSPTGSAQNA